MRVHGGATSAPLTDRDGLPPRTVTRPPLTPGGLKPQGRGQGWLKVRTTRLPHGGTHCSMARVICRPRAFPAKEQPMTDLDASHSAGSAPTESEIAGAPTPVL